MAKRDSYSDQNRRTQVVTRYGTTTTESLLSLHTSLTQLGADWRMLAPSILFQATTTPIQCGGHFEPRKEVSMNPNPDRIVRLKTVIFRSGISRSTIYRKMKDGTFPARVKVNINGIGWHESELNRWIANPPAYRAPELQQ
jgi:prophage regulatory protein